jgi:hypothetical protein
LIAAGGDRAVGSGVIILAMLASILYASTGRTALVVIVVLLVVLAIKRPNAKVIGSIYAPAILAGILAWTTSPYLHGRATLRFEAIRDGRYRDVFRRTACVLEKIN